MALLAHWLQILSSEKPIMINNSAYEISIE